MRLLLILCILTAAALAQKPADDAAVRDVVKRYVAAREARDAKAIEALFTSDADQLVSSGVWRLGREEVVKGTLASSEAAGGKRTISVQTVRFLSPDIAIADGPYEIAGAAESRKMWTSLTIVRKPEGWRITAIRNMLPAAPAR
jgi:uncharacterized protein (TIGR02246 family)